jgi:hypothetical protein
MISISPLVEFINKQKGQLQVTGLNLPAALATEPKPAGGVGN